MHANRVLPGQVWFSLNPDTYMQCMNSVHAALVLISSFQGLMVKYIKIVNFQPKVTAILNRGRPYIEVILIVSAARHLQ